MASLASIRDAVKTTVEANITGLRAHDTIPDVLNPPALVVAPVEADFTVAMGRGSDTWEFDLYVMVARTVSRVGQDALDGYVTGAGASSIRQVIFGNRTLGLANTDAHVSRMSRYGASFDGAGIEHIGAVLRLVVHTSGTA